MWRTLWSHPRNGRPPLLHVPQQFVDGFHLGLDLAQAEEHFVGLFAGDLAGGPGFVQPALEESRACTT